MILKKYNIDEITPLITATEIRDAYTQGHSQRVAYYAYLLASALKLNEDVCRDVYIAGLLHDVGKIGIPDSVLLKPGQLDKEEFGLIKLHSTISGKIVDTIPHYNYLSKIISSHHEDYDGNGYPLGLKAEEIPLEARLLSIADVFDALTTRRIYRSSLSFEKSIEILKAQHKKFDPHFLDIFFSVITKHGIVKDKITAIKFDKLEELRNNFFFMDPLTKSFNRDGLLAILRKSSNYEHKIVFFFINIRDFKEYNHQYGLKKGDTLLSKIAQLFQENFSTKKTMHEPRYKDTYFARIRADKFVLLFIGQRESFLTYKLKQTVQECHKQFEVEIDIKNTKVSRNIENEIGYLL